MRCLVCGEEMRLMQVVEDNTMPVPGYEHHTWQCSACPEVERRLVFTREKTLAETVPVEPTHSQPPAAELPRSAWAQALEKLRGTEADIRERTATARQAASETERHAQFNRDWDKFVPGGAPRASLVEPAQPLQSPKAPFASPAPTASDELYVRPSAWTRVVAKL